MPAPTLASSSPKGLRNEWLLAGGFVLATLLVASAVWLYTALSGATSSGRPQPVWLGVPKVVSQMSDGRVMEVKVNLQLKDDDAAGALEDHVIAFGAVIQGVGISMTKTDVRGAEGMQRYGQAIRESINDYLEQSNIDERVRHVAFEELTLVR